MKNETIKTRQEIEWHIANHLLEGISEMCVLTNDKKFRELLFAITEYVNEKLTLKTNGDITDTFVIVEQELTNKPTHP
ncbi:MAG: hypothetical protein IJX88_05780 [Clostridia bacterium]|nr:hypothetical protein [Clostridia bacterium]